MTSLYIAEFSDTLMTIAWTTPNSPENGNSDVLNYDLYWNNGSGSADIPLSLTLTTLSY